MSLIYVTGAPGAGKTTIEKELRNRGYETHDIDDPDIGGPYNKLTNERVTIPPSEERTEAWFADHEYRVSIPAVEELKQHAKNKPVFVCGVALNDTILLPLFDTVFYLDVDEETLKQRLASREDNDYGKNDFELVEILERRKAMEAKYMGLGVVSIDGAKSVGNLVDELLNSVGLS